jgi:hypothetical protein
MSIRFYQLICLLTVIKFQIYLPALEGHVLLRIIQALRHLIEFSYAVHQNTYTTATLKDLGRILEDFHNSHDIFIETGV